MAKKEIRPINLTVEQIMMLQLSDEDIKAGRPISHEQVNEDDLKWLNDFSLPVKCK